MSTEFAEAPALAPILLIVFNRPGKTRALVDFLKTIPARDIFVAADGARHDGERQRCEEVRAIIGELATHHRLETRFSDHNLGCGRNVSQAILWALRERETVIIVEDDVQITPEFLNYCDAALVRYADDQRITCVSGGPLQNVSATDFLPLFLSTYPNIWGWATWRRAVDGFDLALTRYSNRQLLDVIRNRFSFGITALYWWLILLLVRSGRIDTWDFQFYFLTWAKQGYALTPRANLTQNVGFDAEGTHVKVAPTNVGQLDDHSAAADVMAHLKVACPAPAAAYEAQLDRSLYRITPFTVAKLAVKYVITRPRPYR
jgi:hypothetical protein